MFSYRPRRTLAVIADVVHDLTDFIREHLGGKALIASAIGKDATSMLNGSVYDHLNAAHNLLYPYRLGIFRGGGAAEIWQRKLEEKSLKHLSSSNFMVAASTPSLSAAQVA
ncbi:hypothetical protein F4777DRAFT_411469 [Nemania sp. FL0916]|nr:hypothetical protein F4777DRAFT_411469 [Nemania sp. FL0916]